VVLQASRLSINPVGDATDSVTVAAFPTEPTDALLIRLPIEPDGLNGIHQPSRLVVDKITTSLELELVCLSDAFLTKIWSESIEPLSSFWARPVPSAEN
jgi:hypothetical protein